MADFFDGMADWVESAAVLGCGVGGCGWMFIPSGIDTKGDVHAAYERHLVRHDAQLAVELDVLLGGGE